MCINNKIIFYADFYSKVTRFEQTITIALNFSFMTFFSQIEYLCTALNSYQVVFTISDFLKHNTGPHFLC